MGDRIVMAEYQDQKYTLGRNIKHLRKIYGETQTDLGDALGYSKSAIGSYEAGDKFPKHDTIMMIAKHYGVPVDTLLYSDLSVTPGIVIPIKSSKEMRTFLEIVTPLVKSDQAMLNPDFKKAYLKCQSFLDAQAKGIPTPNSTFEIIMNSFSKAYEETESIEALINMLWCIWQMWFSIKGRDSIDDFHSLLSLLYKNESTGAKATGTSKKAKAKRILEIRTNVSPDSLQLRRQIIEEVNDEFIDVIRKLKKNKKWYELADYYMALRYILSFCDSGESDEVNEQIGLHMMLSLVDLKNKYAIKYLAAFFCPEKVFRAPR